MTLKHTKLLTFYEFQNRFSFVDHKLSKFWKVRKSPYWGRLNFAEWAGLALKNYMEAVYDLISLQIKFQTSSCRCRKDLLLAIWRKPELGQIPMKNHRFSKLSTTVPWQARFGVSGLEKSSKLYFEINILICLHGIQIHRK